MSEPISFADLRFGDRLIIGTAAGSELVLVVRDRFISTKPTDGPSTLTVSVGQVNSSQPTDGFDMQKPLSMSFAEASGTHADSLRVFTLMSKAVIQAGDAFMLVQGEPIAIGRMTSVRLQRPTSVEGQS